MPGSKVYIPDPTWANHFNIWRDAGVEWAKYRYYKPDTRGLDFEGLMEDIHVRRGGEGGRGSGGRTGEGEEGDCMGEEGRAWEGQGRGGSRVRHCAAHAEQWKSRPVGTKGRRG